MQQSETPVAHKASGVLLGEVRVLHKPHPSPSMDKGAVAALLKARGEVLGMIGGGGAGPGAGAGAAPGSAVSATTVNATAEQALHRDASRQPQQHREGGDLGAHYDGTLRTAVRCRPYVALMRRAGLALLKHAQALGCSEAVGEVLLGLTGPVLSLPPPPTSHPFAALLLKAQLSRRLASSQLHNSSVMMGGYVPGGRTATGARAAWLQQSHHGAMVAVQSVCCGQLFRADVQGAPNVRRCSGEEANDATWARQRGRVWVDATDSLSDGEASSRYAPSMDHTDEGEGAVHSREDAGAQRAAQQALQPLARPPAPRVDVGGSALWEAGAPPPTVRANQRAMAPGEAVESSATAPAPTAAPLPSAPTPLPPPTATATAAANQQPLSSPPTATTTATAAPAPTDSVPTPAASAPAAGLTADTAAAAGSVPAMVNSRSSSRMFHHLLTALVAEVGDFWRGWVVF